MKRFAACLLLIFAGVPAGQASSLDTQPVVYAFTRAASAYGTGTEDLSLDGELVVPSLTVPEGGKLIFVNLSIWGHSIYSDDWSPTVEDLRLFNSEVIPFRHSSEVRGVSELAPGAYGFFCSNHMGMKGQLTIVPGSPEEI